MTTVYYAHCLAIYNTPQELRDIFTLNSMGFQVVNPNSHKFQMRYKEEGMEVFFNHIKSDAIDIFAFRALPDGSIPKGVYREIQVAIEAAKPVIELPSCINRRALDLDETREYLKEIGQR